MMATVFFMQPLGQIAGNLVSLIVIVISKRQGEADLAHTVDSMWRWVIGIGVVPGAIATLFRFAIPESPRFLLDIEDDPVKAEFDATTLFSDPLPTPVNTELETGSWNSIPLPAMSLACRSIDEETSSTSPPDFPLQPATLNSPWRLAKSDITHYFWTEGNWRALAGTCLAWLLLDFGFYGIGLSSPQFLAKTWGALHVNGPVPVWKTDDSPNVSVYDMFMHTSVRAMVILNVGSFVGGLLFILFASKLNRVSLQKYGFLALAALFVAMGTMFITIHEDGFVAVILYIIGQILFNFGTPLPRPLHVTTTYPAHANVSQTGPNATTYMIPAEIFPTRYRATCHGLSAAAGKLGSIFAQLFSAYYGFSAHGDARYGWVLIIFSICMIAGAAVTHFWIPSVQKIQYCNDNKNGNGNNNGGWRLRQKSIFWGGKPETLEVLALGRMGMGSRYALAVRRASRGLSTFSK